MANSDTVYLGPDTSPVKKNLHRQAMQRPTASAFRATLQPLSAFSTSLLEPTTGELHSDSNEMI